MKNEVIDGDTGKLNRIKVAKGIYAIPDIYAGEGWVKAIQILCRINNKYSSGNRCKEAMKK